MPLVFRTATLVITDIVASTERFAALPPETAERVRSEHFGLLAAALERHRGTEVKGLGDGIMAVFEAAEPALSCAVDMQRAVAAHHPAGHPPLEMRVGVSTGDVLFEGGDCFGTSVVEASRLCAAAAPGQILASAVSLAVAPSSHDAEPVGPLQLKGLQRPVEAASVPWAVASRTAQRVVIADDAVLVREGIARLLLDHGLEVVAQARDVDELLAIVEEHKPDVVVTDVRMPSSTGLDGLDAARAIRERLPATAVLVLSQHLDPSYARRLLRDRPEGVGYLLKERVLDVADFVESVHRVARGGVAIDPEVSAHLGSRTGPN